MKLNREMYRNKHGIVIYLLKLIIYLSFFKDFKMIIISIIAKFYNTSIIPVGLYYSIAI